MRIKNKLKFIRTTTLMVLSIIGLFIIFSKSTYSKVEVGYTEDLVCKGDTLWSIAEEQAETNKYFENKDIREIVYELKEINNFDSSSLYQGQKIRIPIYQ